MVLLGFLHASPMCSCCLMQYMGTLSGTEKTLLFANSGSNRAHLEAHHLGVSLWLSLFSHEEREENRNTNANFCGSLLGNKSGNSGPQA